jgi:hypothetical protein
MNKIQPKNKRGKQTQSTYIAFKSSPVQNAMHGRRTIGEATRRGGEEKA